MGCEAQLALLVESLENAYSCPLFSAGDFDPYRKVGQTDLVLTCDQGSLVGLCMQDNKSLCAAVTICTARAERQTGSILTSLYE